MLHQSKVLLGVPTVGRRAYLVQLLLENTKEETRWLLDELCLANIETNILDGIFELVSHLQAVCQQALINQQTYVGFVIIQCLD
jgi:hypothetical protein